jgi:N4-gp56 family major capsid protein
LPYIGTSTLSANFDALVRNLVRKTLYDNLRSGLPHLPKGCVIPATFGGPGSGGSGKFTFPWVPDLDATLGAHNLTEGIPPEGQELEFGHESFTCVQSGDFVRLSDKLLYTNEQNLAAVTAERIQRQMAALIDAKAAALWAAGTNAIYSGTDVTGTDGLMAGDILVSADLKKAVALLEASGVQRIGSGFVGLIHPYVKFDISLDDDAGGWVDANRYAGAQALFTGEIGTYAGIRFIADKGITVDYGAAGDSSDAFETTIIGRDSIAFGDLSTTEIISEQGGVSDPLHQVRTVGWKAWIGGMLVGEGDSQEGVTPDPRYIKVISVSSMG